MAWRKLKVEDLRLGLEVRLTYMEDTAFNGATVISIQEDGWIVGGLNIRLARPMAYTDAEVNQAQAMLYCEHFVITAARLSEMAEVWEGRDGALRTHATKAA